MVTKSNPNYQIAELAVLIHGILAGLHIIGVAYNLRKRNWSDTLIHTGAVIYDIHSTYRHINQLKELK